jgi:hypothetical protein
MHTMNLIIYIFFFETNESDNSEVKNKLYNIRGPALWQALAARQIHWHRAQTTMQHHGYVCWKGKLLELCIICFAYILPGSTSGPTRDSEPVPEPQ